MNELTHAKMAPLFVHTPGLFRSLANGQRDKYVTLKHTINSVEFEIRAPGLGAGDLRALQAIAALSGPAFASAESPGTRENLIEKLSLLLEQKLLLNTSYSAVARAAGYRAGPSARALIREAIKRLASVTVSAKAGTGGLALGHLIHNATGLENDSLKLYLSPVLLAAVLGGHGEYLRVSLDEARQLKSDAARLLHHRLHWLNPGASHTVKLVTLMSYVYPEAALSSSTLRTRRAATRRAVDELRLAGWTAIRLSSSETYDITRPGVLNADGRGS